MTGEPMKISTGDLFPHTLPNLGQEGQLIFMDGPNFSLVSWFSGLNDVEVSEWQTGDYLYGAFVEEDVPFLLAGFLKTNLIVEASLNVVAELERGNKLCDFLAEKSDLLNLILVDADTNVVKALRQLIMGPSAAKTLRESVARQIDRYHSGEAVATTIYCLMERYTTESMVQNTQMYKPA
jgi:hypothetical protein